MSSVEADFDRLALLDEEGWTTNNYYHEFLLKHVPRDCANALEIGCGTGAFARLLARRSRRVVGLDLSAEMIRIARSRSSGFDNVEFQLADAMTSEFPPAQFVRETLSAEVDLRASGTQFTHKDEEADRAPLSIAYRDQLNSDGSPSEIVAAGYTWTPGTELTEGKSAFAKGASA